jgi:N-methylhydantoinase B
MIELHANANPDPARRVDDNLQLSDDGTVCCAHCGATVGVDRDHMLSEAVLREGPPSLAGPHVRDNAREFVDRDIVFRQDCCPGCMTALRTQVVPVDEAEHRERRL